MNLIKFFTNKKNLHDFAKNHNLQVIEIEQTHSNNFVIYDKSSDFDHKDKDAVISDVSDTMLCVRTADCLPILISIDNKVICAIHAGRKGTQSTILKKVLTFLVDKYQLKNTTTNKIKIFFGPAICKDCYEIDREKKLHFDLVEENKKQILTVLNNDEFVLEIDSRCTLHSSPQLHSYRRSGKGVPMNYSCIFNKSITKKPQI